MIIPEGWTVDMSVPLPQGKTVDDLVDFVTRAGLANRDNEHIEAGLRESLGLSEEDASVARDRTFVGVIRAGTEAAENRPNSQKGPIAWVSYQRGKASPEIIESLFPGRFGSSPVTGQSCKSQRKPWWRFWQAPGGLADGDARDARGGLSHGSSP